MRFVGTGLRLQRGDWSPNTGTNRRNVHRRKARERGDPNDGRKATIHNLRIAAGLGRVDLIGRFFNSDGSLKSEAGTINWPWGDLRVIEHSKFGPEGKQQLAERFSSWRNDRQGILNNAFVYACMHGHIEAAQVLLKHGAEIDVIPGGFDYAGTGLHYAALNGHQQMIEFLIQHGANVTIRDEKVGNTPAGWADHAGHGQIRDFLKASESAIS